jgi:hypothetical protein
VEDSGTIAEKALSMAHKESYVQDFVTGVFA